MDRSTLFYSLCALGIVGLLSVPTTRSLLLGLDTSAQKESGRTEIVLAGWGNTQEVAMLNQLMPILKLAIQI